MRIFYHAGNNRQASDRQFSEFNSSIAYEKNLLIDILSLAILLITKTKVYRLFPEFADRKKIERWQL